VPAKINEVYFSREIKLNNWDDNTNFIYFEERIVDSCLSKIKEHLENMDPK
jgi:hypothetical protein